jgi:hypothetical protein
MNPTSKYETVRLHTHRAVCKTCLPLLVEEEVVEEEAVEAVGVSLFLTCSGI